MTAICWCGHENDEHASGLGCFAQIDPNNIKNPFCSCQEFRAEGQVAQIDAISIERRLSAGNFGFETNTTVYIHRDGKVSNHQTNPIRRQAGRISNASVIRAKRAQLALVAQAEQPAIPTRG